MKKSETSDESAGQGVLQRAFAVLRVLADAKGEKLRLTDIAARTGQAQATVHRVLQGLMQEGVVEQPAQSKGYQLSVAFFSLAAAAGTHQSSLRSLYRPALLRLSGMLNDTIFLLVRSGFDAVCVDRVDGAFPVRSHTGDIGGRVPLGMGQGGLVLLASLPEAEREEVIRFNIPRLHHLGFVDEISMRVRIRECLELRYARSQGQGVFPAPRNWLGRRRAGSNGLICAPMASASRRSISTISGRRSSLMRSMGAATLSAATVTPLAS